MIRALCAEQERDRILIGCLDVEGDDDSPEVENARTRLMAYYPKTARLLSWRPSRALCMPSRPYIVARTRPTRY